MDIIQIVSWPKFDKEEAKWTLMKW
jgi:hypothetical protein